VAASLTTISASEGLIKSLDPDFDMLRGALPCAHATPRATRHARS
jgi:hypothetical protein